VELNVNFNGLLFKMAYNFTLVKRKLLTQKCPLLDPLLTAALQSGPFEGLIGIGLLIEVEVI